MTYNMNPLLIVGLVGFLFGGLVSAYYFTVISTRKIYMYKNIIILHKLLKNCIKQIDTIDYHPVSIVENTDVDNAVFELIPYLPVKSRRAFNDLWVTYRYDKFTMSNRSPIEYSHINTSDSKKLMTDRINELIIFLNKMIE